MAGAFHLGLNLKKYYLVINSILMLSIWPLRLGLLPLQNNLKHGRSSNIFFCNLLLFNLLSNLRVGKSLKLMLRIQNMDIFFLFVFYKVLLNHPRRGSGGIIFINWLIQTSTTDTEITWQKKQLYVCSWVQRC